MQGHVQNRLLSNKILCLFLFVSDLYHCCRAERYKYIKNYIMKNLILKSLNGLDKTKEWWFCIFHCVHCTMMILSNSLCTVWWHYPIQCMWRKRWKASEGGEIRWRAAPSASIGGNLFETKEVTIIIIITTITIVIITITTITIISNYPSSIFISIFSDPK